jgi:hypothetical protein
VEAETLRLTCANCYTRGKPSNIFRIVRQIGTELVQKTLALSAHYVYIVGMQTETHCLGLTDCANLPAVRVADVRRPLIVEMCADCAAEFIGRKTFYSAAPAETAETHSTGARFDIVNVTTAYRVRITWPDGQESTIGDYPTARIARQAASDWIDANIAGHIAAPLPRRFYSISQFPAADRAWALNQAVQFVRGFDFVATCHECESPIEFRHAQKYALQIRLAEHAVLHTR